MAREKIIDHIKELLKTHDCVVVPGLGGLIGHYEPARRNMTSGTMAPPMKRIAFNSVLRQNDGVLIHHISRCTGASYDAVRTEVDAFVRQVDQALTEHGAFLFPGIGKLSYDSGSKLQFHPILKENLLLDTFSLPLVVAQPIRRIAEQHEKASAVQAPVEPAVDMSVALKTYPSWLFRAAAVVGMAFLLTTAGITAVSSGLDGDQLSFLPANEQPAGLEAMYTVKTMEQPEAWEFRLYERPVAEAVDPAGETEAAAVTEVNSYATVDRRPAADAHLYYIIVGSFLDDARLQREMVSMLNQGFRIETMPGPNGYTRLGLVFDSTVDPRGRKLEEIRSSVNKDAWMIGG